MVPEEAVGFSPWRDRTKTGRGGGVVLEALTITSLATAFSILVEGDSAMIITEHATPAKYQVDWKRKGEARGYRLHLGPTDPDAADGRRVGVGFLTPLCFNASQMQHVFRKASALGRVLRVVLRVGSTMRVASFSCVLDLRLGPRRAPWARRRGAP